MKNILTIILIFTSLVLSAQIGKVPVVERNGKKFYEHTVQKKQTAYGISKMYKIDINRLFEYNPQAQKGLNIGEKLYIPLPDDAQVPSETKPEPPKESIQTEGLNANSTEIIHTVQQGETIWSIARKYGVKPQVVLDANLDKGNNLTIGDKIIIPVSEAEKKDETKPIVDIPVNPLENPEDSIILHKVKKGETLYGIATKYNITQQAILTANPELKDGLKKGMKIRIPLKRKIIVSQEQETTTTEQQTDTLSVVSDSNQTYFVEQKDVYNVAVMLPFFLDEDKTRKANCPPFGECMTYAKTYRALNFHHGIMLAIDSLQKAGMNLKVYVYDTANDTATVREMLSRPELQQMDMIIGPLYAKEIKPVTKFAKAHNIQMIIPVPVSNKALFNNPFVSKMTASKYTQVEYLADYIAEKYRNENVILVRNKYNKKDEVLFHLFKKRFNQALQNFPDRTIDSVHVAASVGTSSKLIYVQQYMKADKKNIIVDLSSDLGHVSNLFTKLATTMNSNPYSRYNVELFGLSEWRNFETIDEKYKNRFNLHIVGAGYVDYSKSETIDFIKKYREKYGTDPNKFAFMGFDATFTNLKGLYLYGKQFPKQYHNLTTKGLYTNSEYKQAEAGSGYENKNVDIIFYDNYHLRKVN